MRDYLSEIFEKSFVSVCFFFLKRVLLVVFSYLVILFSGAGVYGVLSVLIRLQEVVRRLSYSVNSTYQWSLPRYNEEKHSTVLLVLLAFSLFLWVIVFSILWYFRSFIIQYTVLTEEESFLVIVFGFGLIGYLLLINAEYIFRGFKEVRYAMLISRAFIPGSFLLGLIFSLLIFEPSSFWVWIFSTFFFFVFTVISISLLFRSSLLSLSGFSPEIVRDLVSYVLRVFGTSILSLGQSHGTYVLMALYLSPVTAGLFSLALVLGNFSRWFLSGINVIFPPIVSDLYDRGELNTINRLYKSTSKVAILGCCFVSMPLLVYFEEILVIFSSSYSSDALSMVFVVLGQVVATLAGSVGFILLMTSNEREYFYLQFSQTVITLPVMVYLTLQYGVIGLSVSFLFSLSFNNITQLGLLYYIEGLNPLTRDHLLIITLFSVIVLVSYVLKNILSLYFSVAIHSLFMMIYLLLAYNLFLNENEKKSIINLFI